MAIAARDSAIQSLTDLDHGLISREIFVNEDIYQQELERIFARVWLFVGHETQVENPGDYFVSCMGDESVILTRDRQGQLHVFLNTCRHRGMKVCRYDEGNTLVFTCPYHGWSYGTDGKLMGVPYFTEAYREQLDKSQWGLIEVAQLANYKGTIWATWDEEAPPFLDYLGEMKLYLDLLLDAEDGREGGSEMIGGVQKWVMPANWKFAAENNIGDSYHGTTTHMSAEIVGRDMDRRPGRRQDRLKQKRLPVSIPELGHGSTPSLRMNDLYQSRYPDNPIVDEYFRHAFEERQRRLGSMARLQRGAGTVFPNVSWAGQLRFLTLWHPRSPFKTEVWRFCLVDRDAPRAVRDVLRRYYVRTGGPAGTSSKDDMENWNYATAASRGTIARRHPYNYQMGLGFEGEEASTGLPGLVSRAPSEQNQRRFYQRWAQFMQSTGWNELSGSPAILR